MQGDYERNQAYRLQQADLKASNAYEVSDEGTTLTAALTAAHDAADAVLELIAYIKEMEK